MATNILRELATSIFEVEETTLSQTKSSN